ncbi:hypothetical protein B9Z55_002689 [Caenorhabditis nigoni]|uniref:Uncharacterized protein n=1 Tax=Caenorhabditis nigoni TaxID=1611254 RepID=A0A2G5VLM0_9PELO|nr:hypothetical protein B9Z55_002689 [Caenorhabditis nigoni]
MLTLFRYTISVILPIVLHVGCSKKKKALVSTTSKSSTMSSATKTLEKIQTGNTGSKISKEATSAPAKSPTKGSDNTKDAKSTVPPPTAKPSVPVDKKKVDGGGMKKRSSGENGKKKSAKSEQETQKMELEKSKKVQKSCMNTAIGGTMMATVREPSKISKVGTAGGDGGDGEGGYEKLGDLSADELKKIAEAAPV